jgi:nitrate/nitrite transporter NarK
VASPSRTYYGAHTVAKPAPQDDSDSDDDPILSHDQLIKRAEAFTIPYDEERGYRGTELNLRSLARPHMRSFHGSCMCLFVSMLVQFAIAPLLPELQKSLKLAKSEVWLSNIWSLVGGAPLSVMCMATAILCMIALPCSLVGVATTLSSVSNVILCICFRSGLTYNVFFDFDSRFSGFGGVDLTMCNGAAIYFHERFHQSTIAVGAVADLHGVSAFFARGLGGYLTYPMSQRMFMQFRLRAQMISMIAQGLC